MPRTGAAQAKSAPELGALLSFPENVGFAHNQYVINPAQQRAIAISAGDLRATITREVDRLLKEGDPLSAIKTGLHRLTADGQISSRELTLLSTVAETVFSAQRRKIDVHAALGRVRPIYDELLLDDSSSPISLAVCSLVCGSYTSVLSEQATTGTTAKAATSPYGGDVGMVGGAIIGGIIGGGIGGFVGFGLGAAIGGVVGGIAGKCLS